jgi:2-polyprenyl-3-methyl-5-hydroxy-6-metoxy-1,4-benzoquinol methylase
MLDVDGQVISQESLVQRVTDLLAVIDAGGQSVTEVHQAGRHGETGPVLHAMSIAHGQLNPPDLSGAVGARGRIGALVKRAVRKLTSWYVEPRWVLQREYDGQAVVLASAIVTNLRRVDAELDELRRENIRLRLLSVTANERVRRVLQDLEEMHRIADEDRHVLEGAAMKDDLLPLSREVNSLLDRLGAIGVTGADIDYAGFEDVFRGDSGEVRKAQERYLALFPPPAEPGLVVDIGCGRGEMLELLRHDGHQVLGVDTDAGMVEVCEKKGLPAIVDDGIHFLSQTPESSLKGIFCAQVVEHLITPELEQLVRLAFQALRSGGVLVVETINPRSSFAIGNHFYADTSHVRPVHPETLRFICEQIGFGRVQLEERSPHPTLELSDQLPEDALGEAVSLLLQNVFGYQDYVIVATK